MTSAELLGLKKALFIIILKISKISWILFLYNLRNISIFCWIYCIHLMHGITVKDHPLNGLIYFFDRYLMDPFCNKMMRLMLIEQLHNKEIQQKHIQQVVI